MSKGRALRALVKERLTAAAEHIFELFDRTIAEYEEEVSRLKQRNYRQMRRLEEAGIQIAHMKEEPKDEQLQEFPFSRVFVKTEDDESCVLHHRAAARTREETNGDDCEAGCSSEPYLHSDSEEEELKGGDSDDEEEQLKGADSEEDHFEDGSDTDRSEDYSQEQMMSKRNYAVVNPDGSVSDGVVHVKPHGCPECGKGFHFKSSLRNHMLAHTGQKPHTCSVCGRKFLRKIQLKNHMLIHTGEKPFSCPFCDKCFKDRRSLNTHIRVHTGEKPYICTVCQKCFTDHGARSKHMTIHTGQRPFSCSLCDKVFRLKGHLQRHMRTHTGDKPFKCDVCAKDLATKHSLERHLRVHTGEKPFSCTVCQKQFADLSNLNHHEKIHKIYVNPPMSVNPPTGPGVTEDNSDKIYVDPR